MNEDEDLAWDWTLWKETDEFSSDQDDQRPTKKKKQA